MSERPKNIEDILNKLTNVKSAGQSKWLADCPVPGHSTPAKHLSIEDTGVKALVMCFPSGGHTYADICKALGYQTLNYGESAAIENTHSVLVATYDYKNVDGNPLYQICKYSPKTFKARRPDGQWGMGDVKPVLYHLDEIIIANLYDEVVYVCEGEKDADTATIRFGSPGTTNPFGAGKWKPEYSESLRGCKVVVIPDNDPPGQTHCTQVCMSLSGKVKSLKVWRVPAPYKDLTEWVEAGNG
jgi:hypothetical protein